MLESVCVWLLLCVLVPVSGDTKRLLCGRRQQPSPLARQAARQLGSDLRNLEMFNVLDWLVMSRNTMVVRAREQKSSRKQTAKQLERLGHASLLFLMSLFECDFSAAATVADIEVDLTDI